MTERVLFAGKNNKLLRTQDVLTKTVYYIQKSIVKVNETII